MDVLGHLDACRDTLDPSARQNWREMRVSRQHIEHRIGARPDHGCVEYGRVSVACPSVRCAESDRIHDYIAVGSGGESRGEPCRTRKKKTADTHQRNGPTMARTKLGDQWIGASACAHRSRGPEHHSIAGGRRGSLRRGDRQLAALNVDLACARSARGPRTRPQCG